MGFKRYGWRFSAPVWFYIVLAVIGLALSLAGRANAQVSYPPYTSGNPLPAGSGGLGSAPRAAGTGGIDFFQGDSITLGTGATTCDSTQLTVITPNASGTCWADLVANWDGAKLIEDAIGGTCLELGSTACAVTGNSGEVISRYANAFTHLQRGMRYYLMIGTNDITGAQGGGLLLTPAIFRANLITVLSAAAAIVGASNVYVVEPPFSPTYALSAYATFTEQMAEVAAAYGYNFAPVSQAIPQCSQTLGSSDTNHCLITPTDIHPDDNGYGYVATAIESAAYARAVGSSDANRQAVWASFLQGGGFTPASATNSVVGFQSGYKITSGQQNSSLGENACSSLTTASQMVCIGTAAGRLDVTAGPNTYVGYSAGIDNLTGNNTWIGYSTGGTLTGVANSTALGHGATFNAGTDTGELSIGYLTTGIGSHSTNICADSTTPCFSAGTGVPSFSAPNGSLYLNYSLANPLPYINTSGASSSGTTWTLGSPNAGQINCALNTSTSCSATATVTAGVFCSASYDHATTVTLADLTPLLVSVTTTTLNIYADTNASLTGTVYMDYICL